MDHLKYSSILLVHSFLTASLGLYSLFQKGLPEIDNSNMLAILPQLFPLIISAIFLFLLPLFHPEKKLIYAGIILLSFGLLLLSFGQLFQSTYLVVFYPLLLIGIINLFFGLFYCIKLSSK